MEIKVPHSEKDHIIDEQADRTSYDQQIRYTRIVARAKWVEACRERHVFRVRIIAHFSSEKFAAQAYLEWWYDDAWQLIHERYADAPMVCEEAMHSCPEIENFGEVNFIEDCNRLLDIGWAIVCKKTRLQTHWE